MTTNIKQEFETLYNNWLEETLVESRMQYILENENYKKIVEMGDDVVPLIIEKLQEDERSAFLSYALCEIYPDAITVEDGYVSVLDIKNAWLNIYNQINS